MANIIEKIINIIVNTKDSEKKLDDVIGKVDKLTDSTNKNSKSIGENGGAMGLLGAATGGLSNDFKDAVEAAQGFGISLKGLRGAIIATGIGALAILVLELITNWEKWSGVIDGSTSSMNKLNDELDVQKGLLEDIIYQQDTELAIMKAKGVEEGLIWQQEKINLMQKQDILANQIILQKALLQEAIASYNFWSTISGGLLGDEDKIKEATEALNVLENKMTKLNDLFTIKSITRETAAREQTKQTTTTNKEEVVKRVKAIGDEINALDLLASARQKAAGILKRLEVPVEESPIEKLKREYKEEKEILEAANESTLQLTADFNLKMLALKNDAKLKEKQIDEADAAKKKEEDEKKQKEQIESFASSLDELASVLQEGTNEQLAISEAAFQIRKIMADSEISLMEGVQAALSVGSKALGESTALGKTAAIASTTMKTYESATSAYAGMVSSFPGPVGIAAGFAAAGVSIVAGLANVKRILAVKVPGGSGGGGSTPSGGGTGPTVATPTAQFNIIQASQNNQFAQLIGRQQQPIRTYVVGSDVATQLALDRNRVQNATFLFWVPFIFMCSFLMII